ncbi:mRNA interferase RelE/StbE [Kribbella sp. VKM Ac-2527]|uniref:mRNA interferase RelE/StbE n=1 Tax=Kribbella caucasensis TaxID=2512215 RepID=A0A4R6K1W4_9ACTN|nr:type II toxin-antitoxin system RelE/ParE family toxin [Kribbella sp. VKM Ac-2527]TDO43253.1 mRNA interferase RelE/StbE [Kribbella sp. VKM Ac-2527]
MTQRNLIYEQAYLAGFKDLIANDRVTARRLMAMVNSLARNPEPAGSVHLGDSLLYRLHLGDYRVMYDVDDDTVRVWSLGKAPR